MYKNQLQELAQRSCFNLPSYACIREGPDHAPRFKSSVNFNGEIFDSSSYCNTLRQAEHAAAEVALNVLSTRGPSRSLTARVLDETGVYKNLLQETAHRAGLKLPVYTTVRSGPGHVPVFTSTVEMAGMNFTGESAKTKKQAEKNAAIAAWSSLKKLPNLGSLSLSSQETKNPEEQDQVFVAAVLSNFRTNDESKQVPRDQQKQARRRMVRGHRDNASNYSVPYRQLRSMDLLLDSASDGPKQKQNIFVSLLPPPPPRTTSKILPPTSSREGPSSLFSSTSTRPTPIRAVGTTPVKIQEVPPPLDAHQRDEDEWLSGKSDVIKSPLAKEAPGNSSIVCGADSIYSPIPLLNIGKLSTSVSSLLDHSTQNEQTHIRSRLLRGYNPQRIAPAVQIRSVIPVCAAPPLPSMKEAASASPSASSVFKHIVAEASSGSPKFINPELWTAQFDSMFHEKPQL